MKPNGGAGARRDVPLGFRKFQNLRNERAVDVLKNSRQMSKYTLARVVDEIQSKEPLGPILAPRHGSKSTQMHHLLQMSELDQAPPPLWKTSKLAGKRVEQGAEPREAM